MPGQELQGLCQQMATHLSVSVPGESPTQQQDLLESAVKALAQHDALLLRKVEALQQQQEVLLKELQACREQRQQLLKAIAAKRTQVLQQQADAQLRQQTNAGQQGSQQYHRGTPYTLLKCVRDKAISKRFQVSTPGKEFRFLPIVTINLQTTGLDPRYDRVIEFTAIKLMPDGQVWRIGPQRVYTSYEISRGAYEIHGLMEEDLEGYPFFSQCALDLHRFMFGDGGDILVNAYQYEGFVQPLLRAEFRRAGLDFPSHVDYNDPMLVAVKDFHCYIRLEDAYAHYCGKTLPEMPNSLDKARATLEVMLAQI